MNPADIDIERANIDLIRHHFGDFVDRKDVTAAERAVWSGHDAESGQLMEFHGFTLWRFRSDKIVERWATTTDLRPVSHDDPIW